MTDEIAELLRDTAGANETLSQFLWVAFCKDFFGFKVITPHKSFRLKQFCRPEILQQIKANWRPDNVLIYLPAINKSWWGKSIELWLFRRFPWAVEPMLPNAEEKQVIQQHPDYQYWLNTQKERYASKIYQLLDQQHD